VLAILELDSSPDGYNGEARYALHYSFENESLLGADGTNAVVQ
jgi:hypothetical protein